MFIINILNFKKILVVNNLVKIQTSYKINEFWR